LVTLYNREKYISECVNSILKSDYNSFEIIILDDASTDSSYQKVEQLAKEDDRIRLYRNNSNLGQFANRNKIVELAKGEYIKYVDSDDLIYPNCLSVFADAANKYPEAGLIGELYYDNYKGELPVFFNKEEAIISHYFKGNRILNVGPTSLMYKKSTFQKVGGFRTDIGILADVPLNYEIAMLTPIVGTQENLIYWRIHDEQVTIGQADQERMFIERYKIHQLILNHPNQPLDNGIINKIKRNINSILARNLFRLLFTLKFQLVKNVIKNTGLTIKDFILALYPNYKL
jgi:glycosyltransferase involved in cell wall biosynthesis